MLLEGLLKVKVWKLWKTRWGGTDALSTFRRVRPRGGFLDCLRVTRYAPPTHFGLDFFILEFN